MIANYGIWVDEHGRVFECKEGEHHPDVVFRVYRSRLSLWQQEVFMGVISSEPTTEEEWVMSELPAEDYEYFADPDDYVFSLPQWALEHGWTRVVAFHDPSENELVFAITSVGPLTKKAWEAALYTWHGLMSVSPRGRTTRVMFSVGGKTLQTTAATVMDMAADQVNALIRKRGKGHDDAQLADEREKYIMSAWARKAARERGAEENPIPSDLKALAAEAMKYGTFEEFENAFLGQIKHGTYWHFTDNKNFRIDPKRGPRDMSSMSATVAPRPGKLMVTSDFDAWAGYGKRKYAALIDLSKVSADAYWQVNRGFGNEFFVDDPGQARVIGVYAIPVARRIDRRRHAALPQSSKELKDFYNTVWQLKAARERGAEENPFLSTGWLDTSEGEYYEVGDHETFALSEAERITGIAEASITDDEAFHIMLENGWVRISEDGFQAYDNADYKAFLDYIVGLPGVSDGASYDLFYDVRLAGRWRSGKTNTNTIAESSGWSDLVKHSLEVWG